MSRWFVAATPLAGAIIIPIVVPYTISSFGISIGVISTLIISTIWFLLMLKTSEMPH